MRQFGPARISAIAKRQFPRDAFGVVKRFIALFAFFLVAGPPGFGGSDAGYKPVRGYEIQRGPAKDLKAAIAEAHRSGRNILLQVGGNWCVWCHRLDQFFDDHAELNDLREKNFVVLYVNFSEQNKNEKFLSQFSKPSGFPYLYALNADGQLVKAQGTGDLEHGKGSYNPDRIREFLTKYGVGKN